MDTLNKHFQTIAGPAFAKHGFAQAEVLSHWPQIVGAELAAFCQPEKIRWPRGANAQGGTLVVKALAGRSLEVQQSVPVILERIARFLGHGSVQAIKITQSHSLPLPVTRPRPPAVPPPHVASAVRGIDDPDLQSALLRLGTAIAAEKPDLPVSPPRSPPLSPQGKQASGTPK